MGRQCLFLSVGTGASIAVFLAGCGHTRHADQAPCCVCMASPSAEAGVGIRQSAYSPPPAHFPAMPATTDMVTVPSERLPEPPTETTSAKPVEKAQTGVLRVDDSPILSLKHEDKVP